MSRGRVQFQILSRRGVVAGLAAVGALGACDDMRFGAEAPTPDTGGTEPELPPAITSNEDFYVTSCCGTPEIDGAAWSCLVRDKDTELASFDLAWLDARTARDKEHTLECIGANPYNLAISNAVWTGLPLAELFEALSVSVPTDAIEIVFTSEDGYSTSLPVADLDLPVWLVWQMNGVPLPAKHGYLARLLVPGRYGMKNPKWIVEIAFTTEPYTGFWEGYGWSQTAEYKTKRPDREPRAQRHGGGWRTPRAGHALRRQRSNRTGSGLRGQRRLAGRHPGLQPRGGHLDALAPRHRAGAGRTHHPGAKRDRERGREPGRPRGQRRAQRLRRVTVEAA